MKSLNFENLLPDIIGFVSSESLPICKIKKGNGPRHVLLSGIVHGDEEAGGHAILKFLNHFANDDKYKDFTFHAYPCVNPWGHSHSKRQNESDLDINREFFIGTECKESSLVISSLSDQKFEVALDLHETWPDNDDDDDDEDPDCCYLWEICPDKTLRVGAKIIEAWKAKQFDICTWEKIYEDTNNGGVIWYPENCATDCYSAGFTFDAFAQNYTPQSFTIESPSGWDLDVRIDVQITAIITVLDALLDR